MHNWIAKNIDYIFFYKKCIHYFILKMMTHPFHGDSKNYNKHSAALYCISLYTFTS